MPDVVMGNSSDATDELVPLSYSLINFRSRMENTSRGILNTVFL